MSTGVRISSWLNFQSGDFFILSAGESEPSVRRSLDVFENHTTDRLIPYEWNWVDGVIVTEGVCVHVLALFNPLIMQIMHFPRNYGPLSITAA